jgi:hypothetical protein
MVAVPEQSFSHSIVITSACAAQDLVEASDTLEKHEKIEYLSMEVSRG